MLISNRLCVLLTAAARARMRLWTKQLDEGVHVGDESGELTRSLSAIKGSLSAWTELERAYMKRYPTRKKR